MATLVVIGCSALGHVLATASTLGGTGLETCFDEQARRFSLQPGLLQAIAWVESDGRAQAVNDSHQQRTGSRDIGLMQINTSWLPVLAQHGIGLQELTDPCTSIEVGAWILADLLHRHGNSWDAVGAYNAACTQLRGAACQAARSRYAWKVWRRLQQLAPPRQRVPGASPDATRRRPATGLVSLAQLSALQADVAADGEGPLADPGQRVEH